MIIKEKEKGKPTLERILHGFAKGFSLGEDELVPSLSVYDWKNVEEDKLEANVIVCSNRNDNLLISLHRTNLKDTDITALINSGAQGRFIDESVVEPGMKRRSLK